VVRFKPEVIAAASIYMAARVLQIPMVESPEPWWELFDATKDRTPIEKETDHP